MTLSGSRLQQAALRVPPDPLLSVALPVFQRLNGRLNADVCVNPERARKNAQKAEHEIVHGRYRGPLHGIPIALKDHIHLSCIGETLVPG